MSESGERDAAVSGSILINAAIVPPPHVAAVVANLSAELRLRGGLFQVDDVHHKAHMTLYMARIAVGNLAKVLREFEDLASVMSGTAALHTGFFRTPGNYYEASYKMSPDLFDLHVRATERLRDFRYSPGRPVVEKYFGAYSPEQQRNARMCGYDLAGDLYRPHVTITRLSESALDVPAVSDDLSFHVSRVSLFRADDLGAVTESLVSFDLTDA